MTGTVTPEGQPLLPIKVYVGAREVREFHWSAWIDTGFWGDLMVPRSTLIRETFDCDGTARILLADGSSVTVETYRGWISWFGLRRSITILAGDDDRVLLQGTNLLKDRRLLVDFAGRSVTVS